MKHKTWFRLVLKAIGVLLLGLALPEFVQQLGGYMMHRAQLIPAFGPVFNRWQDDLVRVLWTVSPSIIQSAIGLYLLLGGAWIVNMCVPSNRIYCPECGYDMSQSKDASKCSECGTAQPA